VIYDTLIEPFADFGFMRRALVASLALSIGGSSIGVFLILRRMSLMGDALSHALLPGAALGFLLGGLSLPAMSLGGFLAGMATALISGIIARFSSMREDASFAAAYLTSMALGVLIVSLRGSAVDLMNILFGAILLGARAAQETFGAAGLQAAGVLGGLADVDSVTVALARLHRQGIVTAEAASASILLATLANLAVKAGITLLVGGRDLAKLVLPTFLALALTTAAVLL